MAWCTLQAFYEYLILLKVWEMKYMPTPNLDKVIHQSEEHQAVATPVIGEG